MRSSDTRTETLTDDGVHPDQRRQEILDAASPLFLAKGYANTTMADIGDVVGLTGPSLYYYFTSKSEILTEVIRHAADRLAADLEAALRLPPREALASLVDSYVSVTIEEPVFISEWFRERPGLFSEDNRRGQGQYVDEWVMTLGRVRPQLSTQQARVLVQAAIGAINSIVLYKPGMAAEDLKEMLVAAATATLMAEQPRAERRHDG